jgi:hypothetical protein
MMLFERALHGAGPTWHDIVWGMWGGPKVSARMGEAVVALGAHIRFLIE